MLLTISYNPELNIFTVSTGLRSRTVAPAELKPGARLADLAPIFEKARAAVVEGRAVSGISVEI